MQTDVEAMEPESDTPPSEDAGRRRRKLSAIMMADVKGFSLLMGSDEDATVDLIRDFHVRVRRLVHQHEGRVRGDPEAGHLGLDLSEHGMEAYPKS